VTEDVEIFIGRIALDWQQRACQAIWADIVAMAPNVETEIKWGTPYFSMSGRAIVKWFVAKAWINIYFFRG